jgi:glycosyltransferase involved in cell wall biosynthesis
MIRTAFVSSYPPSHSAVAMFTRNLASVLGGRQIVALYGPDEPRPSPLDVQSRIRRDEPDDYPRAARALNGSADVVAIQHELGLWGGPDGSSVLDFARALDVPAVVTLHSVPGSPTRGQRLVLEELMRTVAATVVMSGCAATLLSDVYGSDPRRLEVIPHGTPDLPLVDAATVKPTVGLAGHDVLLSFGLLRPGKGIELALAALPAIVEARPATTYVILGETHPDVVRRDGEAYRESLVALVAELGMRDHVQFVDRFVGRVELTRWLEAADVVVAPYCDLAQTSAGTLPYAMAAGRAVVATPFAHAAELLADARGVVVPAASPAELASAIVALLADPEARAAVGRRAHEYSRPATWWHIAARYRGLFDRVVAGATPGRRPAPALGLNA